MTTPSAASALHVGIDGRAFTSPAAGIRRYARGLTSALATLDGVRVTVIGGDPAATPPGIAVQPEALHPPGNPGWVLVGLPRSAARAGVDVLHTLAYTAPFHAAMPVVVTVHDVSYARHPEWYPHQRDWVRRAYYRLSARRAGAVVTPSHFSASEIEAAYGLTMDRVSVVPMGVEASFGMDRGGDEALPAGVREPFALHVGDVHARRNPDVVLRALASLDRRGELPVQLVLAGIDRGEVEALVAEAGAGRVVVLGSVSEATLLTLYRRAFVLVYPSRYEGFGFPLIEAMAAGLPVMASRAASIPEVAGDAALLVDPEDAGAWADGLVRLLADDAFRADLVSRGRERAALFTWERMARLTLDVYRRVMGA